MAERLSRWWGPAGWAARTLNGASVALGVGLIQLLAGLCFGHWPAMAMSGGAVCASLPDVPNAPQRTWRRVLPAAFIVSAVTLGVGLLHHSPWGMAALIAGVAFLTLMAMAWGLRAGPLSFSGTLAMVFAMAGTPATNTAEVFIHTGWTLAGALVYAGWAQLTASLLRRRYRELAVAQALRAAAARMRSRAARVAGTLAPGDDTIRASIRDDAQLAEALQAARDLVFAARSSVHSRRLIDLVLQLIELRDLLLGSRLDLGLLGSDATAMGWRRELAATLTPLADVLERLADAVAGQGPLPALSAAGARADLMRRMDGVAVPADDPRRALMQSLGNRLGHMIDDVAAMCERAAGADRPQLLTHEQLQLFVSPEGWPLAALKPHLTLQSGVLRHALRGTLAMTAAWGLGLALPWAAHPHWLVLSVAVVLRGSLEQTLSRRNERIIGTVIGCLLTAALVALHQPELLPWIFLAAVGTAHAWVNVRYRVAATAATLMALLQPVMLLPGTHPAVLERLADTVLGAALAWAACFVLPSWERHSLRRQTRQLAGVLTRHAARMLVWAPTHEQQLAQRLSRQQSYAVLGLLAAAAQRNAAEPEWVRLPEPLFEDLLTHGYRLMALLGAVQQALNRRAAQLDEARMRPALAATAKACSQSYAGVLMDGAVPGPATAPSHAEDTADAPRRPSDDWPAQDARADLTPWLLRRLRLCRVEAQRLADVARVLAAQTEPPVKPPPR